MEPKEKGRLSSFGKTTTSDIINASQDTMASEKKKGRLSNYGKNATNHTMKTSENPMAPEKKGRFSDFGKTWKPPGYPDAAKDDQVMLGSTAQIMARPVVAVTHSIRQIQLETAGETIETISSEAAVCSIHKVNPVAVSSVDAATRSKLAAIDTLHYQPCLSRWVNAGGSTIDFTRSEDFSVSSSSTRVQQMSPSRGSQFNSHSTCARVRKSFFLL
ncbi:hypothetical protein K402DRAFT_45986 [Aulographum hederae CBS 113979]|uniref:Uncharacterized protein n=1 Tax=Aulographum hederae CBS 113979 TaxID=1176131 RepID=A0A6G1H455_9PEZI|nr:hypothetical protein K402DRAFT_45986 [Aulographum hederae CBS 113979]